MARFLVPILMATVLFGYFSVFKLEEWEQAVVFRFRQVERTDFRPGLHVMIPFVNTVKKFELRILNMDQQPQRFLTIEKKDVIVDYYVKWRIANVTRFYTATRGGDIEYANTLLGQRINRALRDEFGKRTVQEVVAGSRGDVMDFVVGTTQALEEETGMKLVDVRTKRIDLPEEVSSSVYDRMRAERLRVAKDFRARGAEAAERIRANADRERDVILANAYRDAQVIRGEGDAQATEIYAAAYGKNEEFYSLYRSLEAYRSSFAAGNDLMLLEPDSQFFRYFRSPKRQP